MNNYWDLAVFLFRIVNQVIFFYLVFVCFFYFILFFLAFNRLKRERGLHNVEPYKKVKKSAFTPPLSVLVSAYNEEIGIIGTVLSLVTGSGRLDYPEYEVIVVNDGSKDQTMQKMIERFKMVPLKDKVFQKRNGIETKPIKAVYKSEIYPQLLLVDKANGGKSDALNAGINLSKYPYFASIDGDTILEPDSFLKIMKPIIENTEQEILAAGGNVLIANGSTIVHGQMKEMRLSRNPWVIMQTIEYMRAFLMGRIGLSKNNLLLIISGAFGVFKTARVIQAGGYKLGTIGEDMELVIRLHRMNIENKWGAKIEYVADPVCYTEVPEEIKILRNQRVRWHRGLFESLWAHRKMALNPKYGRIGLIAIPYFLFVELFGPLIEMIGYLVVFIGWILGEVNIQYSLALLLFMVMYGSFLSMGSVLLEEWRLGKHKRVSELNCLFFFALSEAFWYRPIMTYWRVKALMSAIMGKKQGWGEMKRKGVSS
ncbi:glycosyltransferase family 2 protein [Paenibacillus sp. V4I7]|uniref:glycosyltransferase family 2 protein n=1 Tax=Paenibacillus sp. V4I7 TaxID=3042307 RepID=UPI00278856BD|nr:glycosyltransferase [Paenibacillus sp. V4I7]MDQ0903211.1 cellulose synthase/poly-beta-1,6-N-acetylglucosamine synthase-like glycosyltransferase [Paenibacillus sp. V4I7]